MAVVRIPEESRRIEGAEEVRTALGAIGIDYERRESGANLPDSATAAEVLDALAPEVEELKARGGYVTADVIDVKPDTPNLEAMLEKFRREHWHDEDEVRFILAGSGVFHIRPREGPVHAIEVSAGDLIRVPRGTWHWFDLCDSRRIRAVRLFQDPSGWTPHYTGTGAEQGYAAACFGPPVPARA